MRLVCPGKNLRQQIAHILSLILQFYFSVSSDVGVRRLIPDVPGKNPRIRSKRPDNSFDVITQPPLLRRIAQSLRSWALYPARVVHARYRRTLRTELWIRIPAGIEEDENWPDVVPRGEVEKLLDPLLEACRILLPDEIVQEYPHGVHTQPLRPSQLLVYFRRIKGRRLPHFQLINGVGGDEIAAHEPGLMLIPLVGLLGGPA